MAQDPNAKPGKKQMDAEQLVRFEKLKNKAGELSRTYIELVDDMKEIKDNQKELGQRSTAIIEEKEKAAENNKAIKDTVMVQSIVCKDMQYMQYIYTIKNIIHTVR